MQRCAQLGTEAAKTFCVEQLASLAVLRRFGSQPQLDLDQPSELQEVLPHRCAHQCRQLASLAVLYHFEQSRLWEVFVEQLAPPAGLCPCGSQPQLELDQQSEP